MFELIHDIDHKIETVTSLMNESTDEVKTHLNDSILSLYKEKYSAILEEEDVLESIFESGNMDFEEYETYRATLEKMEEETEKIAYPYMTEAAAAISTSLIQNELNEVKNTTNDNLKNLTWLKKRISMYEKICQPEIPFSKLKKKKITRDVFESVAGKVKIPDGNTSYKFISYEQNGKILCAISYSKEDLKNYKIFLEGSLKKNKDYFYTAIGVDNKLSINPSKFISFYKKQLLKESKNNQKAVKECVLSTMEKSQSIEPILLNIEEAVNNGLIDKVTGNLFVEYVNKEKEKSMLEESLVKHW